MENKSKLHQSRATEEKFFKTLVKTVPDIIYKLNPKGMFTFINDNIKTLGYTPEDLIGKHFSEIIHPDDVKNITRDAVLSRYKGKKTKIKQAPKLFDERRSFGRKTTGLEVRLLTKAQKEMSSEHIKMADQPVPVFEVNSYGLYEDPASGKEFTGTIGVIRDISERLEIQKKLLQSEKLTAIGKITANISHDLRNPLSIINNSASYLLELFSDADPRLKTQLDSILKAEKRARKIADEILDFTKLPPLNLESYNVNDLIREALSHIEMSKHIFVETDLDENVPHILLDATQIERVFVNIINNAIDAMPEGGTLTIRSKINSVATKRIKSRVVKIEIKDTGEGIKKENLAKIFEPLFTTKSKGTGLGMGIIMDILERHNGTLNVISELGKETTLIINLPANV